MNHTLLSIDLALCRDGYGDFKGLYLEALMHVALLRGFSDLLVRAKNAAV